MAKRDTKEPKQLTRKQIAYRKRDQQKERTLLVGAGVVAGLILLVLIFGLVQIYVLQPQSPVAKVNGVSISRDSYQKLYSFQNYQLQRNLQQLEQQQAQFAADEQQKFMYDYLQQNIDQLKVRQQSLPQDVLDDMIDDELIRQEAAKRDITVTDGELQAEIEKQFGYDRNPPTPTATPTLTATQVITLTPTPTIAPMTEDEFKQVYNESLRQFQQFAGFGEQDLQALFRADLLRSKVEEALQAEMPTLEPQVHASHILVTAATPTAVPEGEPTPSPEELAEASMAADEAAKAKAEDVLKRVTTGGEDFATVAKEVSTDPGSKENGGDLGWHAKGDFVAEFEKAAFALEPGQIYTDVVKSPFGYHIIKLDEFDPARELEPASLQAKQSQVLSNWLSEQKQSVIIEEFWTRDVVPTEIPVRMPIQQ